MCDQISERIEMLDEFKFGNDGKTRLIWLVEKLSVQNVYLKCGQLIEDDWIE